MACPSLSFCWIITTQLYYYLLCFCLHGRPNSSLPICKCRKFTWKSPVGTVLSSFDWAQDCCQMFALCSYPLAHIPTSTISMLSNSRPSSSASSRATPGRVLTAFKSSDPSVWFSVFQELSLTSCIAEWGVTASFYKSFRWFTWEGRGSLTAVTKYFCGKNAWRL